MIVSREYKNQSNRSVSDLESVISQSLKSFLNRQDIGFLKLAHNQKLWDETLKVGAQFKANFQRYIWVGIGGSSLGTKAICGALEIENIDFIENFDPTSLKKLLKKHTDLKSTGFIFVSKSGSTIEVLTALDFIWNHCQELKIDLPQQSLVISELKSSSLYDWAIENKCATLEIPLDVGGRYSVLSAVGQLALVLGNKNLVSFQSGALKAFDQDFQQQTLKPILRSFILDLENRIQLTYFWFYSDQSYLMGKWLEQLWAESLGKPLKNSTSESLPWASVPIVALGAIDQHSILQQMVESPYKKSVVIHRFKHLVTEQKNGKSHFKETANLQFKSLGLLIDTQAQALFESQQGVNQNALEIVFNELNEEQIGLFFMCYQILVGALGEYLKINAFDQPGVELGKKIVKEKLAQTN